jgi:hypothetical protein
MPIEMPSLESLPRGAMRDLTSRLHKLYEAAGMPGVATISKAVKDSDDPSIKDSVSHQSVSAMLHGKMTKWWKYDAVVRILCRWAIENPDINTEIPVFYRLWMKARGQGDDQGIKNTERPGLTVPMEVRKAALSGSAEATAAIGASQGTSKHADSDMTDSPLRSKPSATEAERIIKEPVAIRDAISLDRLSPINSGAAEYSPRTNGNPNAGASAFLPSRTTVSAHDVEFSTGFWLPHLQSDIADQLLAADSSLLEDVSNSLSDLDELVTKALRIDDLSVAVRMDSEPIAVRVFSQDQFWAALLADLALQRQKPGNMRWLLKRTITGDGHRANLHRIEGVWECIYENFLSLGSGMTREDLFGRLVNAALETTGRDRLKGQLRFLLDLVKSDSKLKTIFRKALEDFCQSHDELPPQRLSDLFYLVGDASDDLQRSDSGLIRIRSTEGWPYEFEVMRLPLTVGDARALSPILAGDRVNPLLPFRFEPRNKFSSHDEFYQNLRKELMAIVRLMPSQADKDSGLQWDVPTFPEWLRLAGCERRPFPWGDTYEPERANLWIKGHVPRVSPVGSFRAGASPHGVDDCCGNVYEIVRLAEGHNVPHSFGLVGHSHRTPPIAADCRHLGRFRPKSSDSRWNIGIRLIRYNGSEESRRRLRS